MKYMQNGSIGDIVAANHQHFGVTIVEVGESFIEFANSAGDHFAFSPATFQGFDFQSYSTPLGSRFAPGVTVQNVEVVSPPPPLGTITGAFPGGWEYEDSLGAAHVIPNPGIYKIL